MSQNDTHVRKRTQSAPETGRDARSVWRGGCAQSCCVCLLARCHLRFDADEERAEHLHRGALALERQRLDGCMASVSDAAVRFSVGHDGGMSVSVGACLRCMQRW